MSTSSNTRDAKSIVRILVNLALFAMVLTIAWYMWPANLGGSTRLIVVEGDSMEPTFRLGDLVMVRDNPTADIGDIVVFHIPEGEPAAGLLVIHRIVLRRPDGTYQTQGDNRATPDNFTVTSDDVIGTPVHAVPGLGRLIGVLSTPLVLAATLGALVSMMLWPSSAATSTRLCEAVVIEWSDDTVWPNHRLPDDVLADAEAWLAEQLRLTSSA